MYTTLNYTKWQHYYTIERFIMAEPTAGDFSEKAFMLSTVFNPTAPIHRRDLFAGRKTQTRDVLDAISQRGQHAVLYGERGVGKTSLANMILPRLRTSEETTVIAPLINCFADDTYSAIWRRVFDDVLFKSTEAKGRELDARARKLLREYTKQFADDITPDIVRRVLYVLGQDATVVVVLDEFETVLDDAARGAISNTLKFLSDRAVPATVVIVGVADDVNSLIANHRSLERCLKQILMPRMSDQELQKIVTRGLEKFGMTIQPSALRDISKLSRGLPHYTHLLGLHSGRCALDKKMLAVSAAHVKLAMKEAISKVEGSIRSDYSKAISSSKKNARYKYVLLACALAETDEFGWFYPRDVRTPLQKTLKIKWDIEAFARHLRAFCGKDHGPVLVHEERVRPRFRFENPLLQPYVLLRGVSEKLISIDDLEALKEISSSDQTEDSE